MHTVTIEIIGNGRVHYPTSPITEFLTSVNVEQNSILTLVASPDDGYKFDSWIGVQSDNNLCCININSNLTIIVKFVPNSSYVLTVRVNGNGAVYSIDDLYCRDYITKVVQESKCFLLTAVPDEGYILDFWNGCDSCDEFQCMINIDSDKEILAVFSKSFYLIIDIHGSGTIIDIANNINCEKTSSYNFIENTVVRLTPIPDDNYKFDHWDECDYSIEDDCVHKLIRDKTVTAIFTIKKCNLKIIKDGTGFGVINVNNENYQNVIYDHDFENNSEIVLLAIPSIDSKFIKWSNSNEIENIFKITQDMIIYCTFQKLYALHIIKSGSGLGFITDTENSIKCRSKCLSYLDIDTSLKLVASPTDHSRFSKWINCNNSEGNVCIIDLTSDLEIEAEFIKVCIIKIHILGNGNVKLNSFTCPPNSTRRFKFDINTNISLSCEANENHVFSNIIGILNCQDGTCSFIIENDIDIKVFFSKVIKFSINFTGNGYGILKDSKNIINCERKYIDFVDGEFIFESINYEYLLPETTFLELEFCPSNCTENIKWFNCNSSYGFKSIKIIKNAFNGPDHILIDLDTKIFSLYVIKSGNGSGLVTDDNDISCGNICYNQFECSEKVKLLATPDESSTFVKWKTTLNPGGVIEILPISTSLSNIIEVIANSYVEAEFKLKTFKVTIEIVGGDGSVVDIDNGINCYEKTIYYFDYGTSLNLIAKSEYGYYFDEWEGYDIGRSDRSFFYIVQDTVITANFKPMKFEVKANLLFDKATANCESQELITSIPIGIKAPTIISYKFEYNSNVTLKAINNKQCSFYGWLDCPSGDTTSNICNFIIQKDVKIIALYRPTQYMVRMIMSGKGSISGPKFKCSEDCDMYFDLDTEIHLIALPDEGNLFSSWTYNEEIYTSKYLTIKVDDDKIVNAAFVPQDFLLTIKIVSTASKNVYVSSSPVGVSCNSYSLTEVCRFAYGTNITLKATPSDCFDGWSTGVKSSMITIELTNDQTITATFKDP